MPRRTVANIPVVVGLTLVGFVVIFIGSHLGVEKAYWASIAGNVGVGVLVFAVLGAVEPRLVRAVRDATLSQVEICNRLTAHLSQPTGRTPAEELVRREVAQHLKDLGLVWHPVGGANTLVYTDGRDLGVWWRVAWSEGIIEQVLECPAGRVVGRSKVDISVPDHARIRVRLALEELDRSLANCLGLLT